MDRDPFMNPKLEQQDSHMIMTNVYKRTKTKYINIDSRYADEYSSSREKTNGLASFTYTMPQTQYDVTSITVRNIEIPYSFYNFSVNLKNTFCSVNDSVKTIYDGDYDSTNLFNELNTATGMIFTIHPLDNKVEIVNNTVVDISLNFDIDENGAYDRNNLKSKLGWCLGFREPFYKITNGDTIEAEAVLNLNPTKYLYLVVDDFQQNNHNNFIVPMYQNLLNKNVLARISIDPNSHTFGSIISVNSEGGRLLSSKRTYSGKADLQRFKFELVNEWGQVMDLNKMDFSFCLEIEYE
jgi:hypothetical protein